jgi:arginase
MSRRTRWSCVGIPIDSLGAPEGSPPFGTEVSPAALRARNLVARLGAADRGDLDVRITNPARDPVSGMIGWPSLGQVSATIRTAIGQVIAAGERPFVLGGCCALVMGAVAGARDQLGRIGLVSVDGHLDLYDNRSSPTGEAADMPTAALLGLGWPGLLAELGHSPLLSGADIALLGARDADEARDVGGLPQDLGVTVRDWPTCAADLAGTAAEVMARFAGGRVPYWLHLDVDVLAPEAFPATDYLMPGGFDLPELTELLGHFGRDDGLSGVSVGCYSPGKDGDGRYGDALADALATAFGPQA